MFCADASNRSAHRPSARQRDDHGHRPHARKPPLDDRLASRRQCSRDLRRRSSGRRDCGDQRRPGGINTDWPPGSRAAWQWPPFMRIQFRRPTRRQQQFCCIQDASRLLLGRMVRWRRRSMLARAESELQVIRSERLLAIVLERLGAPESKSPPLGFLGRLRGRIGEAFRLARPPTEEEARQIGLHCVCERLERSASWAVLCRRGILYVIRPYPRTKGRECGRISLPLAIARS